MSSNARLKLFPSGWYCDMSRAQIKEARQQLRTYAIAKDLDTGLQEVYFFASFMVEKQVLW